MEDLIIQDEFDVPVVEEKTIDIIGISENSIDIKGTEGKEIEKGETDVINKTDDVVLFSGDNNSLRSSQNVDLTNYDSSVIWTNSNPNTSFTSAYYTLDDNINNYDVLGFEYKNTVNSNITNIYFVKVADFKKFNGSTSNRLGLNVLINSGQYSRFLYYQNDTTIWFSHCYRLNYAQNDSTYCIPLNVYGYKAKTLSGGDTPEIPNQIVSGNNIYNFNYYFGVSDNSVSYNLLNKPLNEYTPTESMFALSLLFALCMAFVILIRKVVFRWK